MSDKEEKTNQDYFNLVQPFKLPNIGDKPWCTCEVYYYSFSLYPDPGNDMPNIAGGRVTWIRHTCLKCGKLYKRFYNKH